MLRDEEQARAQACMKEVNAVLQKYNCAFVPVTVIRGNQMSQRVEIAAMPLQAQDSQ